MQPAPGELPQGGNAARVTGRSGVIWIACLSLLLPFLPVLSYLRELILSILTRIHSHRMICFRTVFTLLTGLHLGHVRAVPFGTLLQASAVSPQEESIGIPPAMFISVVLLLIILAFISLRLYLSNKQLRRQEQRHREVNRRVVTAVNHTDTLIVSLDKNGEIRLINEAAMSVHKNWIGLELKAGQNITEALSGTTAAKVWRSWIEKSKNVYSWSEVCKMSIQNRQKYYRVNFSSIQKNDGIYTGLVMMGNDVTFEHEYQSELADQHRALEKSNTDKEQMMGILAHDLKDSIYSAHSMSKMVLEDQDDFDRDHLLRLFEMLHDNFEKTQELLESLLAWQKTRNVSTETRYQEVDLHKVVNEVIANSQEGINRKNLTVENLISNDQKVTTDREMLRTVLRNLVSNAIKFTESHKGLIQISCEVNGSVEIHVKDNGAGIEAEDVEKILAGTKGFTKPGTENENGCGIGLYLCQELLRINQSSLKVNSRPGEGADFHFTLRA